jgi:transcriptional regulator with XRE-family HTH domain
MIQLHIKELAAKKGLLLKDVCEKCGYKSLPSFYRQINNPESISMRTLIKIADVIGCEVADFFVVSDQKELPSSPLVCPHCGKEVCVTLSAKV